MAMKERHKNQNAEILDCWLQILSLVETFVVG
jgi:hypothetical protein